MKINFKIKNNKRQSGAAMMTLVIFVFFISLTIIIGIVAPILKEFAVAENSLKSKQSYFLAESGIEDAAYRIKNNMDIDNSEMIILGDHSVFTEITDLGSNQKQISSLGDVDDRKRKVSMILNTSEGVSFFYGMQAGTGGVTMENTAGIIGNIYSNGPISGSSQNYVTGGAVSANGQSTAVDQSNGSGTPASNNTFGNATSTEDVAQSFQLANTNYLSSAQIYIKKVGSPSNATVTIRTNSSSKPSSTIKATGTLSSSLVSTNYGWVNITFTTNPQLTAGTIYWLTIDSSSSSSNYYIIGGNTTYTGGTAKIGRVSTSTWNQLGTSTDLFFSISTYGAFGSITGIDVGTGGTGDASAHTVTGASVTGTIYCQVESGNNKSCDTSQADPVSQNFPVSDQNITDWKDIALAGGTSGGISLTGSQTQSIGLKKIIGDISLANSSVLTVTGVLWITGNVSIDNTTVFKLSSSYGADGGVIIVDGIVSTNNSATFQGSGASGSYIMVISTNTGNEAVELKNSAGSVIIIAPYGGVSMENTAGAKQVTAKSIHLKNSATITYESGLANASFSSGPSGSWSIESWKETE